MRGGAEISAALENCTTYVFLEEMIKSTTCDAFCQRGIQRVIKWILTTQVEARAGRPCTGRRSTGTWQYANNSSTISGVEFGRSTARPFGADGPTFSARRIKDAMKHAGGSCSWGRR